MILTAAWSMVALGQLSCALLSLVSLFVATGAARRLALRCGSEMALGTVVIWFALVLAPIHLLGVTQALGPGALALANLATCAAVFSLSAGGQGLGAHARATWRAGLATLNRAAALARRLAGAGPIASGALVALALALVWTALLTYLLPSDSWDGLWYHELTTGFAIQNHGYQDPGLPVDRFALALSYPRNGEMMSLWFVIFSDRKLIELPSVLSAIPMALATYCLCQRYAPGDGVTAFLAGVALVLVPAARLEMRSTYIDMQFGALTLAAFYFAADPMMGARRSIMAMTALGLALGTKTHALLSVPALALVGLVFVFWTEGPGRWRRLLAVLVAGLVVVTWLGGVSYALNVVRHHNPLWPVAMTMGPLHLAGPIPLGALDFKDLEDLTGVLFGVPVPGSDYVDTRRTGYGLFGYTVAPFAVVAWGVLLVRTFMAVLRDRASAATRSLLSLTAIGAIAAVAFWKSPEPWSGRYNLPSMGIALVLVQWLSHRFRKREALALGSMSAAVLTDVAMWCWADPGWGPRGLVSGPADVVALCRLSEIDRAAASPLLDPDMVRARERDVGAGDVVVWTDDFNFPGLLWNEHFSNVLSFHTAADPEVLLADAERWHARWLVATGDAASLAEAHPERWQRVAPTHVDHDPETVFRRVNASGRDQGRRQTATEVERSDSVNVEVLNQRIMKSRPVTPR